VLIKTLSTVILQSYIMHVQKVVSLQLYSVHIMSTNVLQELVQYSNCQRVIWNLLSAVTVLQISGHSGGSVLARRWGTPWKKSLSTGAEDGRVAFSLRKRSFTDGKPWRLSRVWAWLPEIPN